MLKKDGSDSDQDNSEINSIPGPIVPKVKKKKNQIYDFENHNIGFSYRDQSPEPIAMIMEKPDLENKGYKTSRGYESQKIKFKKIKTYSPRNNEEISLNSNRKYSDRLHISSYRKVSHKSRGSAGLKRKNKLIMKKRNNNNINDYGTPRHISGYEGVGGESPTLDKTDFRYELEEEEEDDEAHFLDRA